jgi:hypothetical protein
MRYLTNNVVELIALLLSMRAATMMINKKSSSTIEQVICQSQ